MEINGLVYIIAAFTLLSVFYILFQPFIKSMIRGIVTQSILISLLSFIIGGYLKSFEFVLLGILVLVLRGFLVSYLLERQIQKRKELVREKINGVSIKVLISIAVAIIGSFLVYYFVFYKLIDHVTIGSNAVLLFAFMIMFLGFYIIISRKNTMTQIIGYIVEENSLVLISIFLIPVPFVVEISVFLDVITLVLIASIVAKEKFEHTEMEELRG